MIIQYNGLQQNRAVWFLHCTASKTVNQFLLATDTRAPLNLFFSAGLRPLLTCFRLLLLPETCWLTENIATRNRVTAQCLVGTGFSSTHPRTCRQMAKIQQVLSYSIWKVFSTKVIIYLSQGSANSGPWAKSGLRALLIQPAAICQLTLNSAKQLFSPPAEFSRTLIVDAD